VILGRAGKTEEKCKQQPIYMGGANMEKRSRIIVFIAFAAAIIIALASRFWWMDDIDRHPTWHEFISNLMLVVVTFVYVWVTYSIVQYHQKDLELKTKYIVIPDISEVKECDTGFKEAYCIVKNASALAIWDVEVYMITRYHPQDPKNKEWLWGRAQIPALMSGEKDKVEICGLPLVFHADLEETLHNVRYPEKIKDYFLSRSQEDKRHNTFIAIAFTTLSDEIKYVVRPFIVDTSGVYPGKTIFL